MMNALMNSIMRWLAALLLWQMATVSAAQDYPTRAVTIITPTSAGTSADALARYYAGKLQEHFRQSFVVDARPGGLGLVGLQAVANAAPDGYTLLLSGLGGFTGTFFKSLPMDFWKALTPVSATHQGAFFLVVNSSVPGKDFADFVAYAKANPDKLNYGHSVPHTWLATEALKAKAGIALERIPYKSESQMVIDLSANRLQVALSAITAYRPLLANGQARVLATTSAVRNPAFPDVPTFDELGLKGISFGFLNGLMAPTGTPRPVIDRLSRAMVAIMAMPETRDFLARSNASIALGTTPEAFGELSAKEAALYTDTAKLVNYRPE